MKNCGCPFWPLTALAMLPDRSVNSSDTTTSPTTPSALDGVPPHESVTVKTLEPLVTTLAPLCVYSAFHVKSLMPSGRKVCAWKTHGCEASTTSHSVVSPVDLLASNMISRICEPRPD